MKSNVMKCGIRRLLVTALAMVTVIAAAASAYAWFTNQRRLATITKVNYPSALVIGAGAKESSINIDMGSIDVEDESGKKDLVFCVYSEESVENYKLQLAHTSNIDFVYTIYSADAHTSDPGGDRVEYIDESGNSHFYTKKASPLQGSYLNLSGKIADNSLHEMSYGKYDKVQKNAEPLYWQTDSVIQPTNNDLSGFVDYYILEIRWNENVINNKETDMVYLTAGMS